MGYLVVDHQNGSAFHSMGSLLDEEYCDRSTLSFLPDDDLETGWASRLWMLQLVLPLILLSPLLFKSAFIPWTLKHHKSPQNGKDPPQVPHCVPILGNLISHQLNVAKLASSIT